MYFSKDADSVPPPLNHPGSTGAGPWQTEVRDIVEDTGNSKVRTESASLEKYIFNHRYREIRNE